ncbi:MAG: tape measure protein [Zhongshania sp.]|uniref:tape measure protein n=1 Tax=Zhongshania sp. TaxID=1971902 RepID=UPI0026348F88|nr:tape measure protein [Zhongshania sp.]MDF1691776.1 tape measure protein [Zhongshania sp.]
MERNLELSVKLKTAVAGLAEIQKLIGEIDGVGGATEEAADRSRALSDEIKKLEDSQKLVDSFRNIRLEVNKTGDELSDAQAEAQRLGKEFGSASAPTKKLKTDFENARKTVQRLKETQIEQTLALQKSRKELEGAGLSSQKLNAAQAEVRESMQRTTDEIGDLTQELKQARDASAKDFKDPTDKLERGARSAGNSLETLTSRIKRTATVAIGSVAAFFGIREAVRGITGIVEVGGDFEILQARLEALTGSAEAGEEAFAWIKDFTKNTPFQLNEVTDAFIRAKAFGLDPMNGTLQAVADQAAKTGGGIETLNGIVSALGQAYSKGKLQTEEMLQLIERGVPAWDLLAKATGRSAAELQKMATAGELGRKEIQLLIDALGESGAGAAEKQMGKLQGLVSNLKDTFVGFLNDINDKGLLEYIKDEIKGIAAAFNEMKESGELDALAKRISDSIIKLIETVKGVGSFLYEYRNAIVAVTKAWVAYKAIKIGSDLISLGQKVRLATLDLVSFEKQTGKSAGRLGKFGTLLRAVPGPVKIVALGAAFLGLDDILVGSGKAIGEWAAKMAGADDIVAEAQRRVRANASARLYALEDEIAALDRYRDVRQITAEQGAKLSEEERSAYAKQLQGQKDLLAAEYSRALNQELLGENTKKAQAEISAALKATRASMTALTESADIADRAISSGVSASAQVLIDKFRELTAGGAEVAEALDTVFENFKTDSVGNVRAFVEAVGEIATESLEVAAALDKNIAKKLDDMTGQELQRFAITLESAFDGGAEGAKRFADLADRVADSALKNIGTSLQEIRTGISEMEADALVSFATFTGSGVRSAEEVKAAIESLQGELKNPEAVDEFRRLLSAWAESSGENIDEVSAALKALAEDVKGTAEQIAADLSKAIQSAGNEEAINEIRARIGTLYSEGKIGVEEYTRALAEASDRQRELSEAGSEAGKNVADGMDEATESVKEFGEEASRAEQIIGDTASRARGIAEGISSFYNTVTANLISLSQQAHDAFINATGGEAAQRGLDEYRTKLEAVEGQIRSMTAAVSLDRSGILNWFKDTSIAASQVEADFYRQKLALEDLVTSLSNGGLAGRYMSDSIDSLGRRFDLLDDQDLSRLQGAIQRVQAEVSSLNDSLQDTISSLRQELAGLQGDNEQLEQLRYAEQRAELEAQLQKARSLGDREATAAAQEALNLSQQAYNIRLAQAKERTADEKARVTEQAAETERQRQLVEAQQRETTAQNFSSEDRQNTVTQLPSRTIILQAPDGRQASVTTDNEDDLISVLESLGRRVS